MLHSIPLKVNSCWRVAPSVLLTLLICFSSAYAVGSQLNYTILDFKPVDTRCSDVLRGVNASVNKQEGKIYVENELLIGQLAGAFLEGVLDSLTWLLRQNGVDGWLDRDALVAQVLEKCMEDGNLNQDITLMLADIQVYGNELDERPLSVYSQQTCDDTSKAMIFFALLLSFEMADEQGDKEGKEKYFNQMQGELGGGMRMFNALSHLIGFISFTGFPGDGNNAMRFLHNFCAEQKNREAVLADLFEYLIENRSIY